MANDRPALKLHFDQHGIAPEHIDRIKSALGHALARWQHVETAMFTLTHVLLDTSFTNSSVVFFHLTSATQRLRLIDKLCLQCLPKKVFKEEWRPLNKVLADAIDARNGLAHFEITGLRLEAMPEPRATAFPVALSAHHLDVHEQRHGVLKGLFVENLGNVAEGFKLTAVQVATFMNSHVPDLAARMMRLPEGVRTHPSLRWQRAAAGTP